jgi:chromosome segregation ATPase
MAAETASIYRCGNAYTNQPDPTLQCKPLNGGNVTVIEGTRVSGASAESASATNKVNTTEQRQRDAQAQVVLQSELQKAQKQQADLWREWNNGEPERRADEFRQPQKYQARVTQLRAALQRAEADVAGLQRELSRLNPIGVKP